MPVKNEPELDGFQLWVDQTFEAAEAAVVRHNFLSGAAFILWSYHPKVPFRVARWALWTLPTGVLKFFVWSLPKGILGCFLGCLGFGRRGVGRDSFASRYQSMHYRGHTPRDSHFATYQSYGARGGYDYPYDYYGHHEESDGILWNIFSWVLFASGVRLAFVGLTNNQ